MEKNQPRNRRSERLRQKPPANKPPALTTKQDEQSGQQSSNKRKRAAESLQAAAVAPQKVLLTDKDRDVHHWLIHGKMPETLGPIVSIDRFYAPYCARPKPKRVFITRANTRNHPGSQGTVSGEKRSIAHDSNECVGFLEQNGSLPLSKKGGPTENCKNVCKELLGKECDNPKGTTFEKNAIQSMREKIGMRSEIAIIRIIGDLVVPSADSAVSLQHTEFDEPQPDYGVGFSRQAFTREQLFKLGPFIGGVGFSSYFRGTAEMYFPFMASEVKSKTTGLHVADHQNSHSMALCLRGVIYLFKLVKREQELDHKILGFSISHNHNTVRVHGHYPVISNDEITYHRYTILEFTLNSETRWSSYNFVMTDIKKPIEVPQLASQTQSTGISGDPERLPDLAGSANWSPSYKGTEIGGGTESQDAPLPASKKKAAELKRKR
ncbi:hypothetical protein BDW59DRAFT_157562 [Aspergillus cavernicola]|uniref:DUF7924 domain-containing protein n=1 Tax=Aspergillus cavernicola TaxID=176166 RepID=A0ABR4IWF1_9EURO